MLLEIAEVARERIRRQYPGATAPVEDRYPEVLEALDWYLAGEDPERAFRLAAALVPFWISTKRINDGDAWFERALNEVIGGGASRAHALHDHGYLVFWAGSYDLSERQFTRSLTLAEQLGDPSLQALAIAGLARVALSIAMSTQPCACSGGRSPSPEVFLTATPGGPARCTFSGWRSRCQVSSRPPARSCPLAWPWAARPTTTS